MHIISDTALYPRHSITLKRFGLLRVFQPILDLALAQHLSPSVYRACTYLLTDKYRSRTPAQEPHSADEQIKAEVRCMGVPGAGNRYTL